LLPFATSYQSRLKSSAPTKLKISIIQMKKSHRWVLRSKRLHFSKSILELAKTEDLSTALQQTKLLFQSCPFLIMVSNLSKRSIKLNKNSFHIFSKPTPRCSSRVLPDQITDQKTQIQKTNVSFPMRTLGYLTNSMSSEILSPK
jgi:hypothetical protein